MSEMIIGYGLGLITVSFPLALFVSPRYWLIFILGTIMVVFSIIQTASKKGARRR